MKLRNYQQAAVDSVFSYWDRAPSTSSRPASPLIVMPTGSGKSPTLGEIVRRLVADYGCRVVIATHRSELIVQDTKAVRLIYPDADVGIVSAGLGRREYGHAITIGGIQSLAGKPAMMGHVDVMIVDEAHLISTASGTQYHATIAALRAINADMRLVGLTATPYRLGQGYLTEGDDALFTSVAYQTDVGGLIRDGWLAHVRTGFATATINLDSVGVRAGEYASNDLELASDVDKINEAVAADVKRALDAGRTSALVFGTSVAHAKRLRNALQVIGVSSETITGDTPREERDALIGLFKARSLRCITSCDVLTTGFDAPVVDVLALVRPTMSPSLYVQMVGRGMRIADGKADCLLLDYGGNIARHGPVDDVKVKPKTSGDGDAPVKICPQCMACCAASARSCDHCGFEFPAVIRKANQVASTLPALSLDLPPKAPKMPPKRLYVGSVEWARHEKRGDDTARPTLRIDYYPPGNLALKKVASEWVCIEHEEGGFAWRKAQQWWEDHVGTPFPKDVNDAVELLDLGYMKPVVAIEIEKDGKYDRVVKIHHGVNDGDNLKPCCKMRIQEIGFQPDIFCGSYLHDCPTCGACIRKDKDEDTDPLPVLASTWSDDEDLPF
jgi:DNA repair protein RadD